jgi:peptidoglycan hydrolase CwlO-like protein
MITRLQLVEDNCKHLKKEIASIQALLKRHKNKIKEITETIIHRRPVVYDEARHAADKEIKSLLGRIERREGELRRLKCELKQDAKIYAKLKSEETALPDVFQSRFPNKMRSSIYGHGASVRAAYDRDYNYPGCTE